MLKNFKKFLANKLIIWLSDYLPSCAMETRTEPLYILSSEKEYGLLITEDKEVYKQRLIEQYYEIAKELPSYSKVEIGKGDFNTVRVRIKIKLANIKNDEQ